MKTEQTHGTFQLFEVPVVTRASKFWPPREGSSKFPDPTSNEQSAENVSAESGGGPAVSAAHRCDPRAAAGTGDAARTNGAEQQGQLAPLGFPKCMILNCW